MVGNVFSPAYRAARLRSHEASPYDFCTMNVALYDRRVPRWSLSESAAPKLKAHTLQIAKSSMYVSGETLHIRLDEATAPFPGRIRGEVTVALGPDLGSAIDLDQDGQHRWRPIAPHTRATVTLEAPAIHFSGAAYLDSNEGDSALDTGFLRWSWSRATLADGRTVIAYDAQSVTGKHKSLLLQATPNSVLPLAAHVPHLPLPTTRFRLKPSVRLDAVHAHTTLEDTPFYTRSKIVGSLFGQPATVVHEELSMTRFVQPWVQFLLPFRMRNGRPWLRKVEVR
jgi:carotenoid 1,2-hydratase